MGGVAIEIEIWGTHGNYICGVRGSLNKGSSIFEMVVE
jgi:hypothetical protein